MPLAELLDAVALLKDRRGRPRQRPGKLHTDKAYDYRRWVVERTLAWLARMRRLSIRYERRLKS